MCFNRYILKPLKDAERDGDNIFGVIRGCGLNTAGAEQDAEIMTQGRMIVAPVKHAQTELMQYVAKLAGIDPSELDYVEAHATGTAIGDSVEGNAIAEAYGNPDRGTKLRLGSARSNLGHMEASSFTCSLLKVLVMLQKQHFLPVSSHFKEPNPKIRFAEQCMKVQTEPEKFPDRDSPVMFGINSFGFGGANGHCIVEQYKPPATQKWASAVPRSLGNKVFMVPLSAKSETALAENAHLLAERLGDLEENKGVDLFTLAANLSSRMTHFRVRKSISARSMGDLKEQLEAFVNDCDKEKLIKHVKKQDVQAVVVFPGQGSQWAGCGKELYDTEIVFRHVVDAVDKEWLNLSGHLLSDVVFDKEKEALLSQCQWAQPATFLIQVGMYEMLKSQGFTPEAVVGHSAGEVAAAYASGAYDLKEACQLVYHRSVLQQKLAGCGRMLVLMMDHKTVSETLAEYELDSEIEIACFNSPVNTVVCGSSEKIEILRSFLDKDGLPAGKLIPGNIAFHSRYMDPIENPLLDVLDRMDRKGGKLIGSEGTN